MPKAIILDQPGHFGEWLQGRLGPEGPVVLVSLPHPQPILRATHLAGKSPLRVQGAGLTAGRVRHFLAELGCELTGRVRLRARVLSGQGLGVSTASLVVLARLCGGAGPWDVLARACLRAEGASDPLWLPAPERALWASRQGRVLADTPELPRYQIIGGLWGAGQRTDPRDSGFPDISDLVPEWQDARTLSQFAALASESAARCVALRGPAGDPTARLAQRLGALGWIAAHTGGARGFVFAPGTAPNETVARFRAAGYRHLTAFQGGIR